jgi:phosphinothricin acetyltransferase
MTNVIRLARTNDASAMLEIYAPFIRNGAVSFELDVPTPQEFASRVEQKLTRYPWLVCEVDGTVIGYAYASDHATRDAYQWSVDASLYIAEGYRRQGVGRALYTSLFACLRLQGYFNAYAGITLPNEASAGIHEAMGFNYLGAFKDDGYKFGQWYSVGWWELPLQRRTAPSAPTNIPDIANTSEWQDAVASGVSLLKL